MTAWDPSQYLRFEDERTRAARDLLARVPAHGYGDGDDLPPRRIIDLGCGPGNSTEQLLSRFQGAAVEGGDASPQMLAEARQRLPDVAFHLVDLTAWTPPGNADILFANAVFQWVPRHLEVMKRMLSALRPGSVLAVQMPDNFDEPSHRIMRSVAQEAPFASKLAGAIIQRRPLAPVGAWYDAFSPLCSELDIWATTYHHRMESVADITQWVMGAGLRPFLEPLDVAERTWFLNAYTDAVGVGYPPQRDGEILLPFPRRFVVARRG